MMMVSLAQVNNPLVVPDPPPLASGPLVERLLFENGFIVPLLVLTLVVLSPWLLGRVAKRAGRLVQLGLVLILAASVMLPRMVETEREVLGRLTRDLISAVARADAPRAGQILGADAALYSFMAPNGWPRERILESVATDFAPGGSYRVTDCRVLEMQAVVDSADRARVQVKVRVTPEVSGFPNLSWWLIEYRREGDTWRAGGISPLAISGVSNARGR